MEIVRAVLIVAPGLGALLTTRRGVVDEFSFLHTARSESLPAGEIVTEHHREPLRIRR